MSGTNCDGLVDQLRALARRCSKLAANDPSLTDDERLGYLNKADSLLRQAVMASINQALADAAKLVPLVAQLTEQTDALKDKVDNLDNVNKALSFVAASLELVGAASSGNIKTAGEAALKLLNLVKPKEEPAKA